MLYLKSLDLYLSPFLISLLIFHSYNSSFGLLTIFQGGFMLDVGDFTYGIFVVWVPCLDYLSFWLHNVFSEIGKKDGMCAGWDTLEANILGIVIPSGHFQALLPFRMALAQGHTWMDVEEGSGLHMAQTVWVPQITSLSCASKPSSQCLASTTWGHENALLMLLSSVTYFPKGFSMNSRLQLSCSNLSHVFLDS